MKEKILIFIIITISIIKVSYGQNTHSEKLNISHLYGDYSKVWEIKSELNDKEVKWVKRLNHNENYNGPVIIFHYNGGVISGYSGKAIESGIDESLRKKVGGWKFDKKNNTLKSSVSIGCYGKNFEILHLDSETLILITLKNE